MYLWFANFLQYDRSTLAPLFLNIYMFTSFFHIQLRDKYNFIHVRATTW